MDKIKMLCAMAFMLVASVSQSNSLYIFVPSETRATVIEDQIKSLCNGLDVTAFGRAKDFTSQLELAPPSAVLTLLPVIERSGKFKSVLKGVKDGLTEEDYVIVSIDEAIDLSSIEGIKIGVVDLMGRKPMTEFVGQLLQSDVRLKRVSKVEDLLPLLSFGTADALFISESTYENILSKSQLNLVATRVNVKIGLVSAAIEENSGHEDVAVCVQKFTSDLNSVLGVDSWQ